MVQMSDVAKIRQRWIDAGSPACEHRELDQEFYLGARDDDWACLTCGEEFSRQEVRAMREAGGS
ncbi:hypothetical protein AB0E08_37385 [Streptomyces sp. NPDC048281]|uniref:hypothetical protein n=1 Tax=Streptomyces sp. NPDC048281 TaxID=3154715 RepID=UPI0034268D28